MTLQYCFPSECKDGSRAVGGWERAGQSEFVVFTGAAPGLPSGASGGGDLLGLLQDVGAAWDAGAPGEWAWLVLRDCHLYLLRCGGMQVFLRRAGRLQHLTPSSPGRTPTALCEGWRVGDELLVGRRGEVESGVEESGIEESGIEIPGYDAKSAFADWEGGGAPGWVGEALRGGAALLLLREAPPAEDADEGVGSDERVGSGEGEAGEEAGAPGAAVPLAELAGDAAGSGDAQSVPACAPQPRTELAGDAAGSDEAVSPGRGGVARGLFSGLLDGVRRLLGVGRAPRERGGRGVIASGGERRTAGEYSEERGSCGVGGGGDETE